MSELEMIEEAIARGLTVKGTEIISPDGKNHGRIIGEHGMIFKYYTSSLAIGNETLQTSLFYQGKWAVPKIKQLYKIY